MFSLFTSRPLKLVKSAPSGMGMPDGQTDNSVAHQLLERADAAAGRDHYRAQELRDAARAFLSVVR